jgi:cellobiose phosphorylase
LNTKYGIKLSAPGYNGFDPVIGGVTTYPPGAKENGGIFLHANPWMMIAETMRGNGDRAFEYYNQINPAQKNDILDIFESEPYCYPQNILGNEHPQFGMGRNAWLSGTASWTYIAATQYILGIRPELDGLTIDPCLPKAWDKVTVERRFRGSIFSITIVNPDQKMKGVASLLLDGKKIEGNKIPLLPAGHYRVEAYIGR